MNTVPSGSAILILAVLALHGLSACGDDTFEPDYSVQASALIDEGLGHEHPTVRAETLRLLTLVPELAPEQQVERSLEDSAVQVQMLAAELLLEAGHRDAERLISQRMLRGQPSERRAMLRLLVERGSSETRRRSVERALRDASPIVRQEALTLATAHGISIGEEELRRLRDEEDPGVAELAFRLLVQANRTAAFDAILRELHDDRPQRRERALLLSRLLDAPELWTFYRSILRFGDDSDRPLAAMALARLGDPLAEEALRSVVLSADAPIASRALREMRHLSGDRALQQAQVHTRDSRVELRSAALDVLVSSRAPIALIQPLLGDPDEDLATRALLHIQRVAPDTAAEHLGAAFASPREREGALRSVLVLSLHHEVDPLIRSVSNRLEPIVLEDDPASGDLALRLLGRVMTTQSLVDRFAESEASWVRYFLSERMLKEGRGDRDRLSVWAEDDLFFVRLAATLALRRIGSSTSGG